MDVQIGCPCAPREDGQPRHPDGDTVTLRETLGFREVTSIRHAIGMLEEDDTDLHTAEILAVLSEGYVLYGVASWSLADGEGRPLPVSRTAIRQSILANVALASVVADAADALYGGKVLLPLLLRASKSSQPSRTAPSTSLPKASPERRPRPSRPSSTTTTPMAATVTTTSSPAGASSSSQSSGSAA